MRDVYEWIYSPYGWCSFVSVSNATFDHEQSLEGVYFIKNCPSFSFFLGHPQQQNNLQSTTYCKTPSGDRWIISFGWIWGSHSQPISPVIRPRPDLRYSVLESSFCFVSVPGKLLLWLLCCPSRPNKTLYKYNTGEIPNCIANCRNAFLMIGLRYQIRRHRPNIPLWTLWSLPSPCFLFRFSGQIQYNLKPIRFNDILRRAPCGMDWIGLVNVLLQSFFIIGIGILGLLGSDWSWAGLSVRYSMRLQFCFSL